MRTIAAICCLVVASILISHDSDLQARQNDIIKNSNVDKHNNADKWTTLATYLAVEFTGST